MRRGKDKSPSRGTVAPSLPLRSSSGDRTLAGKEAPRKVSPCLFPSLPSFCCFWGMTAAVVGEAWPWGREGLLRNQVLMAWEFLYFLSEPPL